MNAGNIALREIGVIAIGEAVGVALMVGIFALLGKYDSTVLLGGIVGGLIALGHFASLALVATQAAHRAAQQDAAGARNLIQGAYPLRMLALMAVLFLCAGSGFFHVVALTLPLLFVRPVITLTECFRAGKGA